MNLRQYIPHKKSNKTEYVLIDGHSRLIHGGYQSIYHFICKQENLNINDFLLSYGDLHKYINQKVNILKIIPFNRKFDNHDYNNIIILQLSDGKLSLIDSENKDKSLKLV